MKKTWIKRMAFLFVTVSLLFNLVSVTPVYALSAPSLVAPANGLTTTIVNAPPLGIPQFQWAAVAGATKYRIQVSNTSSFTSRIVDITTPYTVYTPSNGNNFSDGIWYWRVRVETPAPVSAYSSIWSFTKQWASLGNAPTLNSPDDSAALDFYDPPIFSWGSVTGAAEYKLQIYSSPGGWSTLAYPLVTTLEATYQPTSKLANGTYYWRVVPVDNGSHDGTPSIERSFTAGYSFVPTLLEPANGANPTFTPTFRWTAVRGAKFYRLQYSTTSNFTTGIVTIDTSNTAYTPTSTIANDVNYYWRVEAHSGSSISAWTPVRTFIKRWYIKPVLLTPPNLYQHVRFPIFSWTPVPGASYYKVEISTVPGFSPIYDSGTTSNTFFTPNKYDGDPLTYYWHVIPFDGNGNPGIVSDTSSYFSHFDSLAPHQIYPFYYYPPDTYLGFPGITTNPHEDHTAPLPIFIWHRLFVPSLDPNQGDIYADAYRLQVDDDPLFGSVNWTAVTENTTAIPTLSNPFTPTANIDYYWRVRPIVDGNDAGEWSQVWKTRFDLTRGLTATVGTAPTLIRPTTGFEFAEQSPLLEWIPLSGATSYDVQISRDEGFTEIIDSANVSYPAYIPSQSLAQRSLGDVDFGIYYWRVRKLPSGNWSEVRHFQISAQSQWRLTRTLGDTTNRLQIGSDPAGDVSADYNLSNLHTAQASAYWYFGFDVPSSPTQNVTYALYLDLDHQDNSGATSDARSFTVATIPAYRPEYAIYVLQESGAFNASKVYLYRWNGIGWDTPNALDSIGGQLYYAGNHVELKLPNTAIGYQDSTGSYAISLFSLPPGGGLPQDTVPSDPSASGSGVLSRFANVTERMNLALPPNNAGIDPSTYSSILPFFWDWPVLSPWSGAIMKAYLDPLFTNQAEVYTLTSNTAYYAQTSHSWGNDFSGDNTYYWRIQPRYRVGGGLYLGAWSQGWRFERLGFVPQNLQTSVTFATPTFSWDIVEGAETYDLQVDNDSLFGSTAININTRQNSYTWESTLANGTYYWRVRVHRDGSITNKWSSAQSFTLALPIPTGLTPASGTVVSKPPTLCWTPILAYSGLNPVLAAWKYRVQVSKDNTFSDIWDSADTEQSCWTPIKGYDDGDYYWRVAMMDGQSKLGNYSSGQTQKFTKQYPTTSLVSPAPGVTLPSTPTFVWTPVNGAAEYEFQVALNSNFSPVEDSITTVNTRWTPIQKYANGDIYYWRVRIRDVDGKVGPYVGSTLVSGNANVDVNIGGNLQGNYSIGPFQSTRQVFAIDSGPVEVKSKNNLPILASERFIYTFQNSKSYAEMMGYPGDQLATDYWFPWYNNISYSTQLRISNMGNNSVDVKVYAGPTLLDTIPLTAGQGARKSYTVDNGPLHVFSADGVTPILASERFIQTFMTSASYAEMMGYPGDQLATEYWFPWYNNLSYSTQLRVSNLGSNSAEIEVYAGSSPTPIDTITLAAGQGARKSYSIDNGPLRVVSTDGVTPILASERFIQTFGTSASYAEMMGYPGDQLTTEYCFPVYNNTTDGVVVLSSQLRVSNMGGDSASIKVYLAGSEVDSFVILAGQGARKSYTGYNNGPLCVTSTDGVTPILASERFISTYLSSSSYSEMMGYPSNKLASSYWFPWYNNISYSTELRIAKP
jgi:hypothetical protein